MMELVVMCIAWMAFVTFSIIGLFKILGGINEDINRDLD